ncbi:DUF3868 domain-containing protein [uncultured Bacteroides sp.]|uniref:DUF3868 domain-containing protein n=1 Tax=uncultured Bacteroides sp. TaxID=162156 RepID=UPI002AA87677|nr:DUF3868 domain-containing protein [uncultured Bacteroides sp.]
MKKSLIVLFLLWQLPVARALCQEAYKGELFVTKKQFSLTGMRLQMELDVDYEGLKLSPDESLTVTPVLKAPGKQVELLPIIILGRERQRVDHRHEVLAGTTASRTQKEAPHALVVENDENRFHRFVYKTTVPFEDWMRNGVLLFRSRECGCNGKPAEVYEDKIVEGFTIPDPEVYPLVKGIDARLLSLVSILTPPADADTLHVVRGRIPFGTASHDYEVYYPLRDAVRAVQQQAGVTLTKVILTGYGSPAGDFRKNNRKGLSAALSLKEYLVGRSVAGKISPEVAWVAEDWDSIRSLVQSSDMLFREATLDIIDHVEVSKGREDMLKELAGGVPYRYLSKRIFPKVRRVEYEICYVRTPLNVADSRHLMETGSRLLSQHEFFSVASSYPRGTAEYNDALDLIARLYPDSPEANINAAAVALYKRDTKRARHYLERFATLPMAYNNMGLLCLLEGNNDKAEVYLQMAAAAGVSQAAEALKQLSDTGK